MEQLAGRGSKLAVKYKVHLQHVTVATMPEDAYDLVLSKLERNSPKDQGDVEYLAKAVPLDPKILRDRYEKELRPNLMARENWHDGTLEMWIGSYFSIHG